MTQSILTCTDAPQAIWGLFDFSIAPPLLYYAYVPIIIGSLSLGAFVLLSERSSLRGKLLFYISLSFSLLLLNEILQWIAAPVSLVQFGWAIVPIFRTIVALLTGYFAYVYIRGTDLTLLGKLIMTGGYSIVLVLSTTTANIQYFDLNNCEGVPGWLWSLSHGIAVGVMLWIASLTFGFGRNVRISSGESIQYKYVGIGSILFLMIFVGASISGDLTKYYDIALIGPIGMLTFLAFVTYIIVRYRAFNIKLAATQALVAAISLLVGARIFYSTTETGMILSVLTFIAFAVAGVFLIRSVKKEIEQREHIEELAGELQKTNERQETLIHFIGHEVKGFLTKDAGAFAAISEGDFGTPPDGMKPFVDAALVESRRGVDSVANILKASNLKKGTVAYEKAPFDLRPVIVDAVEKAQMSAKAKNLQLTFSSPEGQYQIMGDKTQINDHVLRNLIENSINYTPSGSITVSLKRFGKNIVFSVKDTGVGITAEDKQRLFTEGGHGKDSVRVNAHSTGYGLYIAKQITEAHGGTIRAESEGAGKGSTFIAEFPAT